MKVRRLILPNPACPRLIDSSGIKGVSAKNVPFHHLSSFIDKQATASFLQKETSFMKEV